MRVKDVKHSIYSGLKALPWRPAYLAAMWILCGELQSLYADWIAADEIPLMASTMDLTREVVIVGESPQAAKRAAGLADAWEPVLALREDSDASGGLLNTLGAFAGLAEEMAGTCGHYSAANWAANAAEDRWQDWDQRGPIVVDWDEEADDSSPVAQTLALFCRVVSEVTAMHGPEWDPLRIRAQILGER
jgi:hypothetical protein